MTFLEDLYYGNIQPNELPPYESEKYQNALRIFVECEEALKEALTGKEQKLFLQLINAHEVLVLDACAGNFARGCRFAIELLHGCFKNEW